MKAHHLRKQLQEISTDYMLRLQMLIGNVELESAEHQVGHVRNCIIKRRQQVMPLFVNPVKYLNRFYARNKVHLYLMISFASAFKN